MILPIAATAVEARLDAAPPRIEERAIIASETRRSGKPALQGIAAAKVNLILPPCSGPLTIMPPTKVENSNPSSTPHARPLRSRNRALARRIAGVALGVFVFIMLLSLSLHYAETHHLLAAL
jgi:hypothetical protein